MKIFKLISLAFLAIGLNSCDDFDTDLDVINREEPTSSQIGIESTADKLFQGWYNATNSYDGPGLMLATMADQMSCSWGNAAMRDMSSEPRVAWNNNATYGNKNSTEVFFNSMHSILSDSNSIVANILGGGAFDNAQKAESLARFGQAASLGYLALVFDRVYPSDETGILNGGEPLAYNEAIELALEKLDLAIVAAEAGTFEIDTQVNGVTLSKDQWIEFLNSFGARLLVNSPRNATEKNALDWDRVLNYAQNGLSYDFGVVSDGWTNWYSDWVFYAIYPGWLRVDMRIINLMDNSYPDYWPANETVLPEATSEDARLATDFEYKSSQDFPADRGTYHWTTYRYSRYDEITGSGWTTMVNEMLKAENDLYLAEAYLRTGDLTSAAATINNGSRSLRGGLDDIGETEQEIKDAIFYERNVELICTGMGLAFFEMRGNDLLQEGTPLHLPIPGAALNAAKIPMYTFGGSQGTPGTDVSNGGWR